MLGSVRGALSNERPYRDKWAYRGSGDRLHGRTQQERYRYARCRSPAGVEEHITRRRIASEPGRSRVRPTADEAGGPHREGEEPKPMMHGRGKSDEAIVASKPANQAERSAAEPVERRAEAKGNADQQSTHRTPSRAGVTQALERIRKTARERKKERFTALLHHTASSISKRHSSNSKRPPRPGWMG